MAAHRRLDVRRRQRETFFSSSASQASVRLEEEVERERARERGVLRARDLPRLQPAGLGLGDLLLLEAVLSARAISSLNAASSFAAFCGA